MQRRFGNIVTMGNLAMAAVFAGWMLTGSQAMACGTQNQGQTLPQNASKSLVANLALLAKLGAFQPPALQRHTEAVNPQAQADPLNPSIVGLWQVTYTVDGQVVDSGFETYHADGTEMLVDLSPPSTGNVCTGAWAQTGTLTFKLNHPAFAFDTDGNLANTVIIRDVVTIDRSSNSFTGTETVDVFDLNGKLVQHIDGIKLSAIRINPI